MEQLLAFKALIVGCWLALFLVLERLFPASPWRQSRPEQHFTQLRHLSQNASLWLINLLISPLLVISFTAVAASYSLAWRDQLLPDFPILLWVVIDLLLLDLWIYVWHRMNHRIPVLWRFHQVHHLDQQLDATSALRFHFGEVVLSAIVRMPVIYLFAIPLSMVIVFEVLVALAAIFHHANTRLPAGFERALAAFVITPSIHWVHHHAVRADTDSNYGTILSCWDRWFSSLSPNPRVPDMMLGVENRVENRISRLLVLPFQKEGEVPE